MQETGYDLDEGMIVKYHGQIYHGADAMHFLALLTSPVGFMNRINAYCFRTKSLTKFVYPILKTIRVLLLRLRHIPKIGNKRPNDFDAVFGNEWNAMPALLKKRYGDKVDEGVSIQLQGIMTIYLSRLLVILSPCMRLLGVLAPYKASNIPVTVKLQKQGNTNVIKMLRTFYFSKKSPYRFNSQLIPMSSHQVIELMRSNIGVRMHYSYTNNKIIMKHSGYIWFIFGKYIPLPLSLLLGSSYAEEEMLSDSSFRMLVRFTVPIN